MLLLLLPLQLRTLLECAHSLRFLSTCSSQLSTRLTSLQLFDSPLSSLFFRLLYLALFSLFQPQLPLIFCRRSRKVRQSAAVARPPLCASGALSAGLTLRLTVTLTLCLCLCLFLRPPANRHDNTQWTSFVSFAPFIDFASLLVSLSLPFYNNPDGPALNNTWAKSCFCACARRRAPQLAAAN